MYITDADTAVPIGWVSLDLDMAPEQVPNLHVACFSENAIDGEFDGFNVMFLEEVGCSRESGVQSNGSVFKRIGIGEILLAGWFDEVGVEAIVLV